MPGKVGGLGAVVFASPKYGRNYPICVTWARAPPPFPQAFSQEQASLTSFEAEHLNFSIRPVPQLRMPTVVSRFNPPVSDPITGNVAFNFLRTCQCPGVRAAPRPSERKRENKKELEKPCLVKCEIPGNVPI